MQRSVVPSNTVANAEAGNLMIGDWCLSVGSQELTRGEDRRMLDPKDFAVLMHLVESAPDVVSTEDLLERSWAGVVVGDNVVHQVIGRLRKAFGDDARNPRYVETRARRGYRLVAPISSLESNAGAEPNVDRKAPSRYAIVSVGIAVVATLVAAAMLWKNNPSTQAASPELSNRATLFAVPTLKDLSADQSLGWLAYGIAEELAHQVGNTAGIDAIAGALLRADPNLASTADFLVSGSVNRTGEAYVIRLELLNVEQQQVVWRTTFSEEHKDPFELQLRAALAIARYLDASIGATRYNWGPKPISAREPFLKWLQLSQVADDWDEERYWLNRTLEEAPDWSVGWVSKGFADLTAGAQMQRDDYIEAARIARDRALATSDGLEGVALDAIIMGYVDGDLRAMEQRLRADDNGFSRDIYARLMADSGLYREASEFHRLVTEKWQPYNPLTYFQLGLSQLYLGDYESALRSAQQIERLSPPESFRLHWVLLYALPALGRFDEADALRERMQSKLNRQHLSPITWANNKSMMEGLNFNIAFRKGDAAGVAAAIEGYLESPIHVGGVYALMLAASDPRAPEYFELAKAHAPWVRMVWNGLEPFIEPELREHPLVVDLKQTLGFTPEWRYELCQKAATMPKDSAITCDPTDYALE